MINNPIPLEYQQFSGIPTIMDSLFSGSFDKTVKMWDPNTLQVIALIECSKAIFFKKRQYLLSIWMEKWILCICLHQLLVIL